jgi:exodeoxyribonuclease VII large subunit
VALPLDARAIAPTDEVWSVGDLVASVKRVVEGEFMPLWVRGEVVQCRAWSSGHWYFTLRDADAGSQLRCCMWRANAARAGRPPTDGTEVFALGRPEVYHAKGELQLVVSRLVPTEAIGRQQQELERAKAALLRDGLLDPARKRPIPRYACAVAVVTSPDGAALRDVMTVMGRRWPCARLLLVGARVQGDGAADELVRALGLVRRLEVDVCIVGRGGGAREDLAAFNCEAVCRAVAAVPVPTISAVGHQTDIALTDLVADVRAATPSNAAELAVADRVEVLRQLGDLSARLAGALGGRVRLAGERLARSADRLQAALGAAADRPQARLDHLGAQLDALSPLRVLDRGYAVPLDARGRVLRRRAEFPEGSSFTLRLADGAVRARAEGDG